MSYRNTASFGKRQEYIVIAELLKRNFDVYMTLVDDRGIDCVVRLNSKKYLDIQIKARSKTAKNWSTFAAMKFVPKNNCFFIFYIEKNKTYWIIPSKELVKHSYINKTGKNKGKMRADMPRSETTAKGKLFSKYKDENGFKLLRK